MWGICLSGGRPVIICLTPGTERNSPKQNMIEILFWKTGLIIVGCFVLACWMGGIRLFNIKAGETMENMKQIREKPRLGYRVDEVAKLLGVSESTVRRAISEGQITAVKLASRTYVIPAPSVKALLGIET